MKRELELMEQEVAELVRREPQTAFLLRRLKRHHAPTYRQSLLTAYYAMQLAKALDYTDDERLVLLRTALLHDIGKLHTAKEALDNRHRLYEGALWELQEHPKHGAVILKSLIESGAVDGEAVLHHHENLDGTGYPFGLTWQSISLNARILKITGNYTAMTDVQDSIGLSPQEAIEQLYTWSDVLFDARLAELMNRLYGDQGRKRQEKGEAAYDYVSVSAKRNRNS